MTDEDPIRSFDDSVAGRIVETIHEPLLVLGEDFRVVRANPSFLRTYGVPREDVVGRSLFDLGQGEWDVPELRDGLRRVVEDDDPIEGLELDREFPGLGRQVMRLRGRMLRREGTESRHVLVAIEDVTEQRKLEEELRRHARELEHSNADLEQFAYAASHDLQEPLRMVSSYLQLLERRYGDDLGGEAREFIDYAVDGADRMKSLVNGLLQYSRVGRKEGEFGPVELGEVLDDVLRDLDRRIEDLGAEIERGELPATYGDRDQLRRVLQNLLENALTYRGEGPPRIEVGGEERPEGGVHVRIRDHGPGIPEQYREKIFRIFEQLDPHGEGREGSGIGLALCRKIVERHGGTIWIESEPGAGSTFHVTLDLTPEEVS